MASRSTSGGRPAPALTHQGSARTTLRVGGLVLGVVALALVVTAGVDFFGTMSADPFSAEGTAGVPTKFWMFFVGLPLGALSAWMLMAGFFGVATRYIAGEALPVANEGLDYLTDGQGLQGLGRTPDGPVPTDSPSDL